MKNKFLIVILFSIFAVPTFGQEKGGDSTRLPYNFSQFWRETGHYYTTPLHWGGSDAIILGSLVAGTGIAYALEAPAREVIFNNKVLYNSFPAAFGNFYGGLYTPFILFGAYGGYSLITGDMTARKIAFEIGQSCLYAGSIVAILKYTIGRARPYAHLGKGSFFNFSITDDAFHSFPSGHVTEAFAISTVLAFNADPLWLKILAYVPAAFTPFARAYQGYHWISDCVLGAGIGFFTAKWCSDAHGRVDDAPQRTGVLEVKSLWPLTLSMVIN
ncbi:MAG: phosphatase PAP2 family protein [Bacteroidota bacterium]|nr:phosphatase PAP2 family protein [Bacteroidota bacterium]MDP4236656.1 phosphatase PAP2 family protein [Bacteroidota bacterium]